MNLTLTSGNPNYVDRYFHNSKNRNHIIDRIAILKKSQELEVIFSLLK
jgi:hypothetical protein